MPMNVHPYGTLPDGRPVERYDLSIKNGASASVITWGATLISVRVPDRDGRIDEVTLGYDSLGPYLARHPYLGSTVGRVCNRIARGQLTLDGIEYKLATNNPPNHLHGGHDGFDRRLWQAKDITDEVGPAVRMTHYSRDGDEGYPGNVTARVTFRLLDMDGPVLSMEYDATTDRRTPINLTNHAYWNLGGEGAGDVLDHELAIHAGAYLPVDGTLIPIGEVRPVDGTAMDFHKPVPIGARIDDVPGGYDHCYTLAPSSAPAATVRSPRSGRVMHVHTTQPGVQLYTANFLAGEPGRRGPMHKHAALCLETQHWPDAVNQPAFAPIILEPGQTYRQTTTHRFTIDG
jgi:aldose 1-epimerase